MNDAAAPGRLDVLAALLEQDPDASRQADAWVKADGSPAEASLIDSASPEEWDLAAAVRGDAMNDADVSAIVALLRAAKGTPSVQCACELAQDRLGAAARVLGAGYASEIGSAVRAVVLCTVRHNVILRRRMLEAAPCP